MSSTNSKLDVLFQPLQLGTVTIPNRLTMAGLTRNRAPDSVPSDLMVQHFADRAKGGAGLIVTDAILVSRQGSEWAHAPGIWDKDLHVPAWKKVVDAVHAEGGIIFAQLWHLGRAAHPDAPQQKLSGKPVYAPSAIAARGGKFRFIPGVPGYVTPAAHPDPWKLVEEFRNGAVNAKLAGFDGVEFHGANGYLIHQFLDSTTNQRTDDWGGSVEKRARFPLELIKVVQEIWGPNVGFKLATCGGYNDMGMPLEETLETYQYFITEADKLKLAYFVFVRYSEKQDAEYDGVRRSTPHDVIESYRHLVKNGKFIINAGVDPEEGAELIASGKVDAISNGMLWISNPDFALRVKHGKPLSYDWDIPHLQGGRGDDWVIGYNTYPFVSSCRRLCY
ncbi:flavoprotein NADH-dependent oxidoreductase [Flagelloscypha sp. PMI_526]|nr:flavoprotein NADH-dependent oxidoreductase [Flagelloscypha sp. PMI_526]